MSKQNLIKLAIFVVIFIVAAIAVRFLSGSEDIWICDGGQWVKHGDPSASAPSKGCGTPVASPTPSEPVAPADIEIFSPGPNEAIKSPIVLEGRARGIWFFEASAPVKLLDQQGDELAVGYIQARGEWMTTEFVAFSGELSFSVSATTTGVLVFNNDNPSGLPENSKEVRVPVVISVYGNTESILEP